MLERCLNIDTKGWLGQWGKHKAKGGLSRNINRKCEFYVLERKVHFSKDKFSLMDRNKGSVIQMNDKVKEMLENFEANIREF